MAADAEICAMLSDALEVVGIPLTAKGFHVVEIASPELGAALLGRKATRYVASAALVTNMAVHFKWGRDGSLAWARSPASVQHMRKPP